jgi:hypothetical protein
MKRHSKVGMLADSGGPNVEAQMRWQVRFEMLYQVARQLLRSCRKLVAARTIPTDLDDNPGRPSQGQSMPGSRDSAPATSRAAAPVAAPEPPAFSTVHMASMFAAPLAPAGALPVSAALAALTDHEHDAGLKDAARLDYARLAMTVSNEPLNRWLLGPADRAAIPEPAEIVAYRNFVRTVAAERGPSRVIANRSAEHAAVVLEQLFRMGQRSVRIITHQLLGEAFQQPALIDAAVRFLIFNPDATLDILVETPVDPRHQFLQAVREAGGQRVTLREIPPGAQTGYNFNFAVVDGAHYRFEEDRRTHAAIIRFRDPEFGESLRGAFNRIAALIPRAA